MADIFFSWDEVMSAVAGEWLLPGTGAGVSCVLDDSRSVRAGALFVAIVGELADGHNYIAAAARAGAAAVCVQRQLSEEDLAVLRDCGCGCILVADGLIAFQELALAHRRRFPGLFMLGVTGSCGKTSTKEICAAVLEQRWPGQVLKTLGNTNNHFGVPRNLLRLTSATAAAVIEMGTNHPGEIARLTTLAEPNCGLVCHIGAAHLEAFGDLCGVAEEKGDLLAGLTANGTAIVPADAEGLEVLRRHAGQRRVLTFGPEADADLRCQYLGRCGDGYGVELTRRDTGESQRVVWPLGGEHQAKNAAAAVLVGLTVGLDLKTAAAGLRQSQLPGERMARRDIGGVHWVNDAYNANPDSLAASLAWFAEISREAQKRILVLGDMLELGASSERAHREALRLARRMFPNDRIITVGPRFAQAAAGMDITSYPDVAAASGLPADLKPGTWVYLKGSNSIGLAKLMSA